MAHRGPAGGVWTDPVKKLTLVFAISSLVIFIILVFL